MEQARDGNAAALAELVQLHNPWVRRVATRFHGDTDSLEDVLQDAFLEAQKSISSLREPSKFGAWYCGIVLNLCRRRLVQAQSRPVSIDSLPGGSRFESFNFGRATGDPAEVVEEREVFARVIEAVAGLPATYQSATVLFYLRQLSVNEVAAILGISTGAVKVRLHRAREKLRSRIAGSVGPGFKSRIPDEGTESGPDRSSVARGLVPRRGDRAHARTKSRSNRMIKVNIVDVVNKTVASGEDSSQINLSVVVLVDGQRQKALPVWIGRSEGAAIAMGIRGRATPRPLTWAVFGEILRSLDAEVAEVDISKLEESTFHANIVMGTASGRKTLDARPSDALALAVQFGAPVYVADEVMAEAGVDVAATAAEPGEGKSIDAIVAEIEDPKRWGAPSTGMTAAEREEACRDLIAEVFGQIP